MPNVRRVVADVAIGRQEQPWHPTSLFSSWQPNIRRVVADTVLGRQEQPTHPPSLLQSGVGQAPVVPPLSQQPILVRQEQPWHPSPALAHWAPRVSFRPLLADTVLGRQEQPGHPSSSSWPGIYISRAPGQIQAPPLLTTQEFPWHPLPALRHWPAPPPPLFVAGRPVAAYADVRTVVAEPDVPEVGAPMQILALPQFTVAGPLDRDPYTMTFGAWLAGSPQPGDVIVSATSRVLNFDQTPQSSLQVISVAVSPSGTAVTTWLTGGVVGSTYQVDWIVSSLQSRYATKSANLQVVARRS
jgi:hypothetical protein